MPPSSEPKKGSKRDSRKQHVGREQGKAEGS